jgi:hypothetical protein
MFSSHTNPTVPVAIFNISQDFTASFFAGGGKEKKRLFVSFVGGI